MIPQMLALEPASKARMMSVFILFDVMGLAAGTAILPRIYLVYGYRQSGASSFAFVALSFAGTLEINSFAGCLLISLILVQCLYYLQEILVYRGTAG